MTVYIYNGYGASPTSARLLSYMFRKALGPHAVAVENLSEDDLNCPHALWKSKGQALVFGGGEFTKVKERLQPRGWDAVRDFAASRTYIGICKGAYAGAAHIEFEGDGTSKKSKGFELFNGAARGSLPLAPKPYTGAADSAAIVPVRHRRSAIDFPALYWGGPAFDFTHSDTNAKVIATAVDSASGTDFAIGIEARTSMGGKAILLGYHPEAAIPVNMRRWLLDFCNDPKDRQRLDRSLNQYTPAEFYLAFANLLDDAAIVPSHSFVNQVIKPNPFAPALNLQP